jgi:coenzyme F420-reducing hydrogenase alpha subunit
VNVKVGGFYKAPSKRDFARLAEDLKWAADASEKTIRWTAQLPFPDFEQDYELVSLSHPDEYPMNEGRLVSNRGLDIAIAEYEQHFEEQHVPYTNALQSVHIGHGAYFVGPMARFALNFDKLTPRCQALAREVGLDAGCRNPFRSIIVRSVIASYEPPEPPSIEVDASGGAGSGCTEAPRGLLYHRYRVDEHGDIQEAKIVPPTSQNQKTIEDDLRRLVPGFLHLDDDGLQWQCEQAIRNYDPCISCATHFLKIHREDVSA